MSYSPERQPISPVAPQSPTNSMAMISMIAGIVGMLGLPACCCSPAITGVWFLMLGVPAAIMGWLGRNQIIQSGGQQGGEGMAMAGLIMGIIEVVIALLFICLAIFSMMGMIALPAFEEFMQNSSF